MKYNLYVRIQTILATCCLCIFFTATSAQNSFVYDVFTNTAHAYKTLYETKTIEQFDILGEMEIRYFSFGQTHSAAEDRLNLQIKDLCTKSWQPDDSLMKIFKELKQRTRVYEELLNNRNNLSYGETEYIENRSIDLTGIDCNPISVVSGILWFQIHYAFEVGNSSNRSGSDHNLKIRITHYYTANLTTGVIRQQLNRLNPAQCKRLSKGLSERMNERYSLVTSKLSISDLNEMNPDLDYEAGDAGEYNGEDEENTEEEASVHPEAECKDICSKMDFREADIYWNGWGMVISFQDYTKTSTIYTGLRFRIFIPFWEKEFYKILPEFAFALQLRQPPVQLQHFNKQAISNEIGSIRRIPEIEEVVLLNPLVTRPKSLLLERSQVYPNGKENFTGSFSLEFDTAVRVLSKTILNKNQEGGQQDFYSYSRSGSLTSHIRKVDEKEISSETCKYDGRFNLSQRSTLEDGDLYEEYYFYNGNTAYTFSEQMFRDEDEKDIEQIAVRDHELSMWGNTYILDDRKRVTGLRSSRYSHDRFQIARDNKGRITEAHYENDRHNYYFIYDEKSRLAKYQYFEYQKPVIRVEYFYEAGSSLPSKRMKISEQQGNRELELYKWTTF